MKELPKKPNKISRLGERVKRNIKIRCLSFSFLSSQQSWCLSAKDYGGRARCSSSDLIRRSVFSRYISDKRLGTSPFEKKTLSAPFLAGHRTAGIWTHASGNKWPNSIE